MEKYIAEHRVCCPKCGKCDWTSIRNFNLMFSTSRGVTDDSQNLIYLRPECDDVHQTIQNHYKIYPRNS